MNFLWSVLGSNSTVASVVILTSYYLLIIFLPGLICTFILRKLFKNFSGRRLNIAGSVLGFIIMYIYVGFIGHSQDYEGIGTIILLFIGIPGILLNVGLLSLLFRKK
jgi:hypothetical protein